MYDIQKDVSVPPARAETKYPFDQLEVGDGFEVPYSDGLTADHVKKRVYGAVAWANRKKSPKRFIGRVQDESMLVVRTE